jgi:hypothetical protein
MASSPFRLYYIFSCPTNSPQLLYDSVSPYLGFRFEIYIFVSGSAWRPNPNTHCLPSPTGIDRLYAIYSGIGLLCCLREETFISFETILEIQYLMRNLHPF